MNLPTTEPRCDGLLPKMTTLNGEPQIMWSIDCPRRDQCARYCQMERDTVFNSRRVEYAMPYLSPSHTLDKDCPHFIAETTDESE